MEWLQKIYILVLGPVCNVTERIDEKRRTSIAAVMMFLLYAFLLVWYSVNMFDIYVSLTSRMVLAVFLLAIFIIFIGNKNLHIVKWNNWVAISWFACGILIFLMGFVAKQNFGYWLIGPVMAFGFPCLYFVIGNSRDINKCFLLVCKAVIVASLIYFIAAIFAETVSDNVWVDFSGRYNGTTSDANRIGEICVASFACSIYIYRSAYSNLFWKILSFTTMAFCICDSIISISRSTIIAISCMVIYFVFLEIKSAVENKKIKQLLINMACIALCIIIGVVFTTGMRAIHKHMEVEKAVQNVTETSQIETEKAVAEETVNSVVQIAKDSNRMDVNRRDLNTFSAGRINIWKEYLSNTGILGNPADGKTPISGNLTNVAAHNTIIEISYRSGIVTGLLFLFVEILAGIYILRILLRKNNEDYDYFAAFAFIGYIIVSNLQVAYNPLTSIIFFVYAISISILVLDKKRVRK